MRSGYQLLFFFMLGALGFVAFGYFISRWLQTQKPNAQKLSAYECGEEASGFGHQTFNFRFYLPALIFLIFEVEIVMLAPILLAQKSVPEGFTSTSWFSLVQLEAVIFIALLGIGYALAWSLGFLNWEKPTVEPMVFEGPVPDFAYEQSNLESEKKWALRKNPIVEKT
jgi:NADH-quinone oxidoreductase subunit A